MTHVFHIRIVTVCVIFYILQACVTRGRKCNELSLSACTVVSDIYKIHGLACVESSNHINVLTVVNQDISRGRALEIVGPKKERSFEYPVSVSTYAS